MPDNRTAAETRETLKAEVLVSFKRLGSDRVHYALVMPETIHPGSHWGAECEWLDAPVAGFCRRTLRGRLVKIPAENLDGWKRAGKVCRECVLVAEHALTLAESIRA